MTIGCVECKKEFNVSPAHHRRGVRRCSNECASVARRGRPKSAEHRVKLSIARRRRGKIVWSLEARQRQSMRLRGISPLRGKTAEELAEIYKKVAAGNEGHTYPERQGANCSLWRGGTSKPNQKIRGSYVYKKWRRDVLERDNYTCVNCSAQGCPVHADHIKSFAHWPELRFDVLNGRTLCVPCHRGTPSYLNPYYKEDLKPKV